MSPDFDGKGAPVNLSKIIYTILLLVLVALGLAFAYNLITKPQHLDTLIKEDPQATISTKDTLPDVDGEVVDDLAQEEIDKAKNKVEALRKAGLLKDLNCEAQQATVNIKHWQTAAIPDQERFANELFDYCYLSVEGEVNALTIMNQDLTQVVATYSNNDGFTRKEGSQWIDEEHTNPQAKTGVSNTWQAMTEKDRKAKGLNKTPQDVVEGVKEK